MLTNQLSSINPALQSVTQQAVAGLESPHSRRVYRARLTEYLLWGHGELPTRSQIQSYLNYLQLDGRGPSSLNQTLSALKRLVEELSERDLLNRTIAQSILSIKRQREEGVRVGNWLTLDEAKRYIDLPTGEPEELRDKALLATLIGCGVRREEAANLTWSKYQRRWDRWVWVDIVGKRNKIRSVAVPDWAAERINAYRAQFQSQPQEQTVNPASGQDSRGLRNGCERGQSTIILRGMAEAGPANATERDTGLQAVSCCDGDRANGGTLNANANANETMGETMGDVSANRLPNQSSTGQISLGIPPTRLYDVRDRSGDGLDRLAVSDRPGPEEPMRGVRSGSGNPIAQGESGDSIETSRADLSQLRRVQSPTPNVEGGFSDLGKGTAKVFNLSPSGIWWIVKRYARILNLNLSPHDLRRTFSALAEQGGADLRQIQSELGHASIQTTERYLGKITGLREGKSAGDHIRI